jgi:hypothetical protein
MEGMIADARRVKQKLARGIAIRLRARTVERTIESALSSCQWPIPLSRAYGMTDREKSISTPRVTR